MTPHRLHNLLSIMTQAGINEIMSSHPRNRFQEIEETLQLQTPQPPVEMIRPPVVSPSIAQSQMASLPLMSPKNACEKAQNSAQGAQTLEELRTALVNFDGCALKYTATNLVFGDGNPKARLMLIGEAPGVDEDRQGLPFVGQSGQLLDKMFACIGLTRQNFYITNIIPWRPPGNRQPTPLEAEACLPFVQRHIDLVDPDFLILVGGTATKTLLGGREGIVRLRGTWKNFKTEGGKTLKVMPIFHPAYLLRSPGQKREVWLDLVKIKHSLLEAGFDLSGAA